LASQMLEMASFAVGSSSIRAIISSIECGDRTSRLRRRDIRCCHTSS
jgi:hypothetical protein